MQFFVVFVAISSLCCLVFYAAIVSFLMLQLPRLFHLVAYVTIILFSMS